MPPTVPPADPAEIERLRAEVTRLARDNDALRARVATLATGGTPAAGRTIAPGAVVVTRTRRWVGRVMTLVLFVLGLALGAWFAQHLGAEFARGYRDGRADAVGAPERSAPAP